MFAPKIIELEEVRAWGRLPCHRARNLIAQEVDADGSLWATRGMWAYRRAPEAKVFERRFRVPTGASIYGLMRFAPVRRLARYPECVDLVPFGDGAVALGTGALWSRPASTGRFVKKLPMRHFGMGVGSGVSPVGPGRTEAGGVLFGEYFRNAERGTARVYLGEDCGRDWRVVHEFEPGRIKHIHIVRQDPFTGDIWIGTGDRNDESMVIRSPDGFENVDLIGEGSQAWRTLVLQFTERAVYWGTDTGDRERAGLYRWDRSTREVTKLLSVPECFFYGGMLTSGTMVMTTDRHGDPIETDATTRMWLVREDREPVSLGCGDWVGSGRYGLSRLARGYPYSQVALTCLNQREYDQDLLVFDEDVLWDAAG